MLKHMPSHGHGKTMRNSPENCSKQSHDVSVLHICYSLFIPIILTIFLFSQKSVNAIISRIAQDELLVSLPLTVFCDYSLL